VSVELFRGERSASGVGISPATERPGRWPALGGPQAGQMGPFWWVLARGRRL